MSAESLQRMIKRRIVAELEEAIGKAMADNARYRAKLGEQALKYAALRKELATAKELIAVMEERLRAFEESEELIEACVSALRIALDALENCYLDEKTQNAIDKADAALASLDLARVES